MYLYFQSSSGAENSRKEAVLLAKMKHPNVVAFKESFEGKYKNLNSFICLKLHSPQGLLSFSVYNTYHKQNTCLL